MSPSDASRPPSDRGKRAAGYLPLLSDWEYPYCGRMEENSRGERRRETGRSFNGISSKGEVPCRSDLYRRPCPPRLFARRLLATAEFVFWIPHPLLVSDLRVSLCHAPQDRMGVREFIKKRPLRARDNQRTNAAELTLRQSVFPIVLVTILFFLWGFSYGKRERVRLRRYKDARIFGNLLTSAAKACSIRSINTSKKSSTSPALAPPASKLPTLGAKNPDPDPLPHTSPARLRIAVIRNFS